MRRARARIVVIAAGALALAAAPCCSQVHRPEYWVPRSEVIALFEVERGNVTPETILNAPADAGPRFDFHVLPTVRLRVKQPLKGCGLGHVFEVPTPQELVRMPNVSREFPRPVFLYDGDEVLAYLRIWQGQYRWDDRTMVQDGKLEISVDEQRVDDDGCRRTETHTEQVSVPDALRMIQGYVRRWDDAQTYDTSRQDSARMIDDFGQNKWLDERILEELVRRQDAIALGTITDKADDLAKPDIAKALARVAGAEPVPYLIRLLDTRYSLLWLAAIDGLARPEAKAAVPKLTQALARKDAPVPIWRSIGPIARAMVATGDAQGVEEMLEAAANPRAGYALPEVIEAIAGSPDPAVDAFLLGHLHDFPIEIRPQSDAIPKQRETNRAAAKALGRRGNDAGVQRLLEMLEEDRTKGFPGLTVKALGELGDRRALPALLALLREEDQRRQDWEYGAIAAAAVKILDDRAVAPLIELIDRSQGGRREALIRAVGEWDHPAITAMLVTELNGDDAQAMCAAALVLHKRGVKQAANRLSRVLETSLAEGCTRCRSGERYWIYVALKNMKEQRAVPALIAAMAKEGSGYLSGAAASALREITGVDLPTDPEMWRKWWEQRGKRR